MRRPKFLQTAIRWYGYVVLLLLLVLLVKIALGNPSALASLTAFAEVALQPVNLYAWGFLTALYAVFVLSMWMRLRGRREGTDGEDGESR